MTKYHVNVVMRTMPPLSSVYLAHTQKFDSFTEAKQWADKFKFFLKKQKRNKKGIKPSKEEIEFHGGLHFGAEFEGIQLVIVLDME